MNSDAPPILFGSVPEEYRKDFFEKLLAELRTNYKQLTSPGTTRSAKLNLSQIPASNTGLRVGDVWEDTSFLRLYEGAAQDSLTDVILNGIETILTTRGQLLTRNATTLSAVNVGAANTLLKSDGTDPSWSTFTSYLDTLFTTEANGDLLGRTGGAWTNRTLAAVLGDMLTDQGMIFRRTASGVEGYQANTNNTLLGGNGSGVASRDAAFVRSMIGYERSTWTPTITASSGTFTTVSATGNYMKLERWVSFFVRIVVTTVGTASGQMRFTLPYATAGEWPVYGLDLGGGGGLVGNVNNPSSTQGFVLRYDATSAISATAFVVAGNYEATS